MKVIGHWMQRVGLLALPAVIILQVIGALSVRDLLVGAVGGLALFWLGRILEGHAST